MKFLTLIRHAKSDWSSPELEDFERPLNRRGKEAALLMGQRLADRGLVPDLIISSPARRARKTARRLARELSYPVGRIDYVPRIYEAERDTLIELVRTLRDIPHVVLVGHNPGFSELGRWFCPAAPEWLPTCAVLTLRVEVAQWHNVQCGCALIENYDYPKKSEESLPGGFHE